MPVTPSNCFRLAFTALSIEWDHHLREHGLLHLAPGAQLRKKLKPQTVKRYLRAVRTHGLYWELLNTLVKSKILIDIRRFDAYNPRTIP